MRILPKSGASEARWRPASGPFTTSEPSPPRIAFVVEVESRSRALKGLHVSDDAVGKPVQAVAAFKH